MNTASELIRRGEKVFTESSMEDLLLQPGEKVFIVDRRLFEEDIPRHFVGEVEMSSPVGFRAKGYPYYHNSMLGNFVRKNNPRTRVFTFDNNLIINVLPDNCDIEKIEHILADSGTILTDSRSFKMDVSEFGFRR